MFDIAIIGAGVIGCAIARELAKYDLKICLIEKSEDVGAGTTKANSGIVHGGYADSPGSVRAQLCARGNLMYRQLEDELHFGFSQIGSLVVGFDDGDNEKLQELRSFGEANGVPQLQILTKSEIQQIEPNLNPEIQGALYCPTAGVTSPYEFTVALAENAVHNGVTLRLNTEVIAIELQANGFALHTSQDKILSKLVINAAGLYADEIARMVGLNDWVIQPRSGQYLLLDKEDGELVKHVVFQVPNAITKGILVTRTYHGNLLVGPDATMVDRKDYLDTLDTNIAQIVKTARKTLPSLDPRRAITSFAGNRAATSQHDFIIEESGVTGFINVAGIESPGLTAAPAIARRVVELVANTSRLSLHPKKNFDPYRKPLATIAGLGECSPQSENFTKCTCSEHPEGNASGSENGKLAIGTDEKGLEAQQINGLIQQNADYGCVVCRCEQVSRGEIRDALHREVPVQSLDAIKRRTRAGMGRCQGGFCTPKVMEIISEELDLPKTALTKKGGDSWLVAGETKHIADAEDGGAKKPFSPCRCHASGTNTQPRILTYDVVIIGGGPAGMAAALSAKHHGVERILIIERDEELGGILNQCVHNGFGVHRFKRELTGPEYSELVALEVGKTDIQILIGTMVIKLDPDNTVHAINGRQGYLKIETKAVVLAMGCRERTRGAIQIHGSRPAGVFAAGTAQRLINIDGLLPGKRAVILGSGDIGLITARRMTLEGAKVEAVLEIMPYSNGLTRNIVQCLDDFGIPLFLSTTITKIHGQSRVEGVTVVQVDQQFKPIPSTERFIACDTVLLSVGLIPENELSRAAKMVLDPVTRGPLVGEFRQTSQPGVFACGNVLQVHDLVDFVSDEGELAGEGVARYLRGELGSGFTHRVTSAEGIGYVVPQRINLQDAPERILLFMRVKQVFEQATINVYGGGQIIARKRGAKFLPAEMVSLELKRSELAKVAGDELIVKVETSS